jgi:hypothetical protein
MSMIKAETWVEIEKIILAPEDRAPSVPEDTKRVPYVMRASGFLQADSELGQIVKIRTMIGRELEGKLITVNPSYSHSFGKVVPEILKIGTGEEAL